MSQQNGRLMSLRELAVAAGVTVPTLRHYFGARQQIVDAIFEEALRLGRQGLDAQRRSDKSFEDSIHDYLAALVLALRRDREPRLGDLFAISFAEGLLDAQISPSTLKHILDPTIDVLVERLSHHISRGEMLPTDPRAAALMLLSPILLASLHQNQLHGESTRPMDLGQISQTVGAAFIRAFRKPTE